MNSRPTGIEPGRMRHPELKHSQQLAAYWDHLQWPLKIIVSASLPWTTWTSLCPATHSRLWACPTASMEQRWITCVDTRESFLFALLWTGRRWRFLGHNRKEDGFLKASITTKLFGMQRRYLVDQLIILMCQCLSHLLLRISRC